MQRIIHQRLVIRTELVDVVDFLGSMNIIFKKKSSSSYAFYFKFP